LPDRLLNAGPVQKKAVGRFTLTVDRELARVLVACHRHGSEPAAGAAVGSAAGRDGRYSGLSRQQVCVATPVERHFRHMLAADGFADLRIGHLNRDNVIVDLHCLTVLFDLQGRVDLECAVYVNRHTYLLIIRVQIRRLATFPTLKTLGITQL
jgi:hypothetical protein